MTAPTPPTPEQRDWLRGEIEQWQRERLVPPDQAQALLARYGLVPGETPRTLHRSRIVYLLAGLGAVLVGVGVILLVGANWEGLPKWLRMALLMAVTLAAYHGGFVLAYRRKTYPKVGLALLLVGSLCWGASIFLVGQMYHLTGGVGGGEMQATLCWFLGVLPLAYVLLSPLHLILALVLWIIWFTGTMAEFYHAEQAFFSVYLGAGVLLCALAELHAGRRRTGGFEYPYWWVGLLMVFATLYAFSFRTFWGYSQLRGHPAWQWPGVLLALAGVAVLAVLLTRGRRDRISLMEGGALLALLALGLAAAMSRPEWFAPQSEMMGYSPWQPGSYAQMAAGNLLLLAAAVGVIALGWVRNQPGLATFGIFVFFVQVVTRYFDLLWGQLSSGLLFVGAGLLLLGAGWALEHSRRKLLQAMAERGPT